ncbi:MAG: PA2169 family four-helix-bundle protein, partial [Blastocatellia bacterium]
MAIRNEDVISVLNNLIETCRDGQNGFQSAVEGVNAPDLRGLFEQYAHQREHFVEELQNEVLRLGGDPQNKGSVAA